MTKKLIGTDKINSCPGLSMEREGRDIEAIVHSFEDGSTEVYCMYFNVPIADVADARRRCMREYLEERKDHKTEQGRRCIWYKY